MKKILIFAIALATLSLTSCKDFLDLKPMGTPNQDAYFENDYQIENAVKSIYSPLADGDDLFGRDSHWEQCLGITMVPGRTRDWPELFCLQWNGDESPLRSVFEKCYAFGARANWIVYSLEKKQLDGETLSYVGKRSLGEAYFIRAWLHMTIAYRYGTKDLGCPWVNYDEFLPDAFNAEIPEQKASVCDNYAMIVSDFKKAAELLPWTKDYSTDEKGRASKDAAMGMLARAYAYWATWDESKWADVITTVNEMESAGKGLMPTFSEMFNDDIESWWNKEYCWSIPGNGGYNPRTGCEFPGVCLENKGWGVYNGWGQFKPSYDGYEEFLKDGDRGVNERLRRTILEYGQEFEYNGVTMKYYGAQDVETGFQINKWMEPFKHADFVNTGYVNEAGGSWPSARVNFHVIRFADCMLLRAEAYLHQNNAAAAAKDLNAIRKRAGLAQSCSGSWMELYHERVCELMFETMSDPTYDLKRWAVGAGVGSDIKAKAIANLEGHPRALFHVWRSYPDSPVGQGANPKKTADGSDATKDLGPCMNPQTGEEFIVKGIDYQEIKTDLGDPTPGVGPYQDYVELNKKAKWDPHFAVYPYPSQQITKSAGKLQQNAGY